MEISKSNVSLIFILSTLNEHFSKLWHFFISKEMINSLTTVANCTSRLERWLSPTLQSNLYFHLLPTNKSDTTYERFAFLWQQRCIASGLVGSVIGSSFHMHTCVTCSFPYQFTRPQGANLFYLIHSSIHRPHDEQQIDRIAQEYTKLQHFVKKCENHPFVEDLKPVKQIFSLLGYVKRFFKMYITNIIII